MEKSYTDILASSNVYVELQKYEGVRNKDGGDHAAKYEQIARIERAKLAYLDKIQASRKVFHDRNPSAEDVTADAITERLCIIGSMPGWKLPNRASLEQHTYFAIGANGLLYRTREPHQRESFNFITDTTLMTFSLEQLLQLAESIVALQSGSAWDLTKLNQSHTERS